jgi:hypothetical protein
MNLNVKIAVGCLVFLFAISFTETLLGAEDRPIQLNPELVTLEVESYEFLITLLCDKHVKAVELAALKAERKPPSPGSTFKNCINWAVREFQTEQLFRS